MVIIGPDATAGSIFIFLKKSGVSVPTALDTIMASISEMPIQPDIAKEYTIPLPLKKKIFPRYAAENTYCTGYYGGTRCAAPG